MVSRPGEPPPHPTAAASLQRAAARDAATCIVVDGDDALHALCADALASGEVAGRKVVHLHARTMAEARSLLEAGSGAALLLVGATIEQPGDGLSLVAEARSVGLVDARVVLVGLSPGEGLAEAHEIDEHRAAGELSVGALRGIVAAALRSHERAVGLRAGQEGLERIVQAASALLGRHALIDFARGVLEQLALLVGVAAEGLLCEVPSSGPARVIYAAGRHEAKGGRRVDELGAGEESRAIRAAMSGPANVYAHTHVALRLSTRLDQDMVVFLETGRALSPLEVGLVETLASNLEVALENIELMSRLEGLAFRDRLTGLGNLNALLGAIDNRAPLPARHTLALVDVDAFAEINDAMGYPCGDQLIRAVGERLSAVKPDGGVVARIAGDTFALFGPADAISTELLRAQLVEPFEIDRYKLRLKCRIGVAGDDEARSGTEVLQRAFLALNDARKRGRGSSASYAPPMLEASRDQLALTHALQLAVERGELALHYQPQVDLRTGRTVGAEALMRWPRQGGAVPPMRFIPVAERAGLISELGAWALRTACLQQRRWRDAGLGSLRIGVNVSAAEFRAADFVDRVERAISDTGVDPSFVELEITESVALDDPTAVVTAFERLRSLGVALAIDDFGTGYSSLAYLHRLPAQRLKIDRIFVRDHGEGAHRASMAESIVQLAHQLGMHAIAEGVETREQAAWLAERGCEEAQGFLYSPALAPEGFEAFVRQHGGPRDA